MLEGECLATSYMSRTTTSYLSREIRWGRRFVPCTKWDKERRQYIVDHKQFNKTEEVTIPLCSAQRLIQVYDDIVMPYTSPLTIKYFEESINEESDVEAIKADIHYIIPNECDSSSSSEEYSLEDLVARKQSGTSEGRPRTLSGTAKDFLASLQRYVTESGPKNNKYEETSF